MLRVLRIGKTETTKDLGKNLGMYVIVINCSEGLDYKSMGKMFSGEYHYITVLFIHFLDFFRKMLIFSRIGPNWSLGLF